MYFFTAASVLLFSPSSCDWLEPLCASGFYGRSLYIFCSNTSQCNVTCCSWILLRSNIPVSFWPRFILVWRFFFASNFMQPEGFPRFCFGSSAASVWLCHMCPVFVWGFLSPDLKLGRVKFLLLFSYNFSANRTAHSPWTGVTTLAVLDKVCALKRVCWIWHATLVWFRQKWKKFSNMKMLLHEAHCFPVWASSGQIKSFN